MKHKVITFLARCIFHLGAFCPREPSWRNNTNKQYPAAPPPQKKTGPKLVRVISSAYQRYLLSVMIELVTDSAYRDVESMTENLASTTDSFYSTTQSPIRAEFDMYCSMLFKGVLNPKKMAMVANTHYVETNKGGTWSPPSWTPPSSPMDTLTPFDVVVLLAKSVFGFSDGSTPFWQSTIEWPLQTALVNQMIHLHNATLHNPKFVEISTDVGRAMDELLQTLKR